MDFRRHHADRENGRERVEWRHDVFSAARGYYFQRKDAALERRAEILYCKESALWRHSELLLEGSRTAGAPEDRAKDGQGRQGQSRVSEKRERGKGQEHCRG